MVMKVSSNICSYDMNIKKNNNPPHVHLKMDSFDTVSFKGYDHLRLEGFDSLCASSFKLHLEKFKSKGDFNDWAKKELDKKFDLSNYKTNDKENGDERLKTLEEWKQYILSDGSKIKTPALALLVFHSITKSLKPDGKDFPPDFKEDVLIRTVNELETRLKDKNCLMNFDKTYRRNLKLSIMQEIGENELPKSTLNTGWVKVESYNNDKENFKNNVQKLKNLSGNGWCLKGGNYAHDYLLNGDFHVYLEEGEPRVGIRFIKDKVDKIQGAMNNGFMPAGYYGEIQKYINEGNFDISKIKKELNDARIASEEIPNIKPHIDKFIKQNDYTSILKHFKLYKTEDKARGFLSLLGFKNTNVKPKITISQYSQPSEYYSYSDLGIDENKLLKNVVKIQGNADFKNSKVSDLSSLEEIGEDALFENSSKILLSNLKSIGKDAYFVGSRIKDLSSLENIGGHSFFSGAKDVNLSRLKTVGKDAFFDNTVNLNARSLEQIGGKLWNQDSKHLNTGNYLSA